MTSIAKKLASAIGSFGFAVILLLFLLLLTWLGTLEQVEHGLFVVQKKYFEQLGLIHWTGERAITLPGSDEPAFTIPPLPLPLPGVYLILMLLFVNLLIGGLVRIRKDRRTLGILITHLGMVLMLVAGFVKFQFSFEGNLGLWPGEQGAEFTSYHDWELVVREAVPEGVVREQVIPDTDWNDLARGKERRFTSDALPFDLTITRAFANCEVVPKGPMFTGDGPVIDGYVVLKRPLEHEDEQNVPGLYVTCTEHATNQRTDAIVWGLEDFLELGKRHLGKPRALFTLSAGGKEWLLDLRKKRYPLPFSVRLDKFDFGLHPGITTAKFFSSDVTKFDGGQQQAAKISMNEPLRHGGYTIYQGSYGPANLPTTAEHYSVFVVVSNPSDQWPKWSCYIIAVGLLLHFVRKLRRHVEAENRRAVVESEVSG